MWQKWKVSPVPHHPDTTRWSAVQMKKKMRMTVNENECVSSWLWPWHTPEQKPWWLNNLFWISKNFRGINSLPLLFHSQWRGTLSEEESSHTPGKSTWITGHMIQMCSKKENFSIMKPHAYSIEWGNLLSQCVDVRGQSFHIHYQKSQQRKKSKTLPVQLLPFI